LYINNILIKTKRREKQVSGYIRARSTVVYPVSRYFQPIVLMAAIWYMDPN